MSEETRPETKITIELPWNDHWDEEKVQRIINASHAFGLIWDIDQNLRHIERYMENVPDDVLKKIEEIRGDICESKLMDHYS